MLARGLRTQDGILIVFYLEYVKLGFRHHGWHPEPASGHEITMSRLVISLFFLLLFSTSSAEEEILLQLLYSCFYVSFPFLEITDKFLCPVLRAWQHIS